MIERPSRPVVAAPQPPTNEVKTPVEQQRRPVVMRDVPAPKEELKKDQPRKDQPKKKDESKKDDPKKDKKKDEPKKIERR